MTADSKISYRDAVEEAATMHSNLATQYRLLTDEPEMVAAHRNKAAALTQLAALIERAERIGSATTPDITMPPEFDILSSGERPSFEEWDAIVRELGTGYLHLHSAQPQPASEQMTELEKAMRFCGVCGASEREHTHGYEGFNHAFVLATAGSGEARSDREFSASSGIEPVTDPATVPSSRLVDGWPTYRVTLNDDPDASARNVFLEQQRNGVWTPINRPFWFEPELRAAIDLLPTAALQPEDQCQCGHEKAKHTGNYVGDYCRVRDCDCSRFVAQCAARLGRSEAASSEATFHPARRCEKHGGGDRHAACSCPLAPTASQQPPPGGERKAETAPPTVVSTDNGAIEWRLGNAKGDYDAIQKRQLTHPNTTFREWHGVHGAKSVAVSLERIRAWASLLPSATATTVGGWGTMTGKTANFPRCDCGHEYHDHLHAWAIDSASQWCRQGNCTCSSYGVTLRATDPNAALNPPNPPAEAVE